METLTNITLGSTSAHKLDAVRQACQRLGLEATISGVKASSGQNEQPVGLDETFSGALTRALSAKSQKPTDVAIGIESGIFRFGATPITLDFAIIVVITNDGKQIVTTSEGIQFPEEYTRIAEKRGFKTTTVGSIITEQLDGSPTDPHSALTNGKITRTMTLVDAVTTALQQL